jgi:hypothetical protein
MCTAVSLSVCLSEFTRTELCIHRIPGAGQTFVMEIMDGSCRSRLVCGYTPALSALCSPPPPPLRPIFFVSPGTRDYMIDINGSWWGTVSMEIYVCPGTRSFTVCIILYCCSHFRTKQGLSMRESHFCESSSLSGIINKIPTFYGIPRFITVFTTARHRSPYEAKVIQFALLHPICFKVYLISFHLRQSLSSSSFLSDQNIVRIGTHVPDFA